MDYKQTYKQLQAKRIDQDARERYIPMHSQDIQLSKKVADAGSFGPLNWRLAKKLGPDRVLLLTFLISKYNLYETNKSLTSDNAFYCTTETIKDLFGWSWNKQNQLFNQLEELGYLKLSVRGTPPKRYVQLQIEKVLSAAGDSKYLSEDN